MVPMVPINSCGQKPGFADEALPQCGHPCQFELLMSWKQPVYCGKKILTSGISGPDQYQQVVLGVCRGVYGPIVGY